MKSIELVVIPTLTEISISASRQFHTLPYGAPYGAAIGLLRYHIQRVQKALRTGQGTQFPCETPTDSPLRRETGPGRQKYCTKFYRPVSGPLIILNPALVLGKQPWS